jgi:tetratricopeptide (TPR) repeat protein
MEAARATALLEALRERTLRRCSLDQCREFLNRVVLDGLDMPEGVFEVGSHVFAVFAGKLGDERWDICERVVQAAVRLGRHREAGVRAMLVALKTQFPTSNRVLLQVAMVHEADEKYSAADELYDDVLAAQPTNAVAMKRKICVKKALGQPKEAVRMLTQYVTLYSADTNAWKQLVHLYVDLGKLDCAQFACEELLLLQPESFLCHLLCADVLYALAQRKEDYKGARRYYAQALELNPTDNARALYGVLMCTKQAGLCDKDAALYQGARAELLALYKSKGAAPALVAITEQVFQ